MIYAVDERAVQALALALLVELGIDDSYLVTTAPGVHEVSMDLDAAAATKLPLARSVVDSLQGDGWTITAVTP